MAGAVGGDDGTTLTTHARQEVSLTLIAKRSTSMFTDDLATPTRVETLIELIRSDESHRWSSDTLGQLLQPDTLRDVKSSRPQATRMLRAAKELGLVKVTDAGNVVLTVRGDSRSTGELVCAALDEQVLGKTDVEPFFAPFYSFMLGLGKLAGVERPYAEWVKEFAVVYPPASGTNQFNKDKLTGLHRWFSYAGLGWYDPRNIFQCNPYERLRRRLPGIFASERELPAAVFITRLADCCPELDGGTIFREANPAYDPARRRCTLGLGHALVELHLDRVLRLHCPPDSDGWDIREAAAPRDTTYLRSERIDRVELLSGEEVA
jgi:hypothetical protein